MLGKTAQHLAPIDLHRRAVAVYHHRLERDLNSPRRDRLGGASAIVRQASNRIQAMALEVLVSSVLFQGTTDLSSGTPIHKRHRVLNMVPRSPPDHTAHPSSHLPMATPTSKCCNRSRVQ